MGRAMELCEAAKKPKQVVDQFPSAAGGEDWVLCARTMTGDAGVMGELG